MFFTTVQKFLTRIIFLIDFWRTFLYKVTANRGHKALFNV